MIGNEVANIITSGVLSVLGTLASYSVTVGVNYLKKKRESLIQQIGVDAYNKKYKVAEDLYYLVEQDFRFIPDAGEQKAEQFNKLLAEKVPGITQKELDHFRETICGKVNAEIKDSGVLAPVFDRTKDTPDVAAVGTTETTQK